MAKETVLQERPAEKKPRQTRKKAVRRAGKAENETAMTLKSLREEMVFRGIDQGFICNIFRDGLQAEKKGEPDYAMRLHYVELVLKMLGVFPPEKTAVETLADIDYSEMSDEQLERIYKERIDSIRCTAEGP